jgi:subtilisin family serine protease
MKRLVIALASLMLMLMSAPAMSSDSRDESVLVKYRRGTSEADKHRAEASVQGERANRLDFIQVDVIRVNDRSRAVAGLSHNPHVEFVEANTQSKSISASNPNDPSFGQQWNFNNGNDADIDGPEGWAKAYGTNALGQTLFPTSFTGPVIGIIDTGIASSHPDLSGKVAACANALTSLGIVSNGNCGDDNGHGTHVSGIAAARTNNAVGVAGTAPGSRIAMCKALNAAGLGWQADIDACMGWLKNQGVSVISMSLGGGSSSSEQAAVRTIWNNGNGTLMVAAAGNDGDSSTEFPAGYAEVVSVASTTRTDAHSSFSNTNADVEVSAPGTDVYSTYVIGPVNGYSTLSGTSMATPHAGGMAAMIKLLHPTFNALSLRNALDAAVDDLGAAGRDSVFGFGRLNLSKI